MTYVERSLSGSTLCILDVCVTLVMAFLVGKGHRIYYRYRVEILLIHLIRVKDLEKPEV